MNSPEYVFTLGTFLANETKEVIERNLVAIIEELKALKNGIDLDVVTTGYVTLVCITYRSRGKITPTYFDVEVFFCSDYAFNCKWLGLSPKSHYFCTYCEIHKDQICSFDQAFPKHSFNSWTVGKVGVQV